jgi:hypothetical protein
MNFIKLFGKIIFLLFTIFYLIIPLILVLNYKINRPTYKNLNDSDTLILAIITFACIIINYIFIKNYISSKK